MFHYTHPTYGGVKHAPKIIVHPFDRASGEGVQTNY